MAYPEMARQNTTIPNNENPSHLCPEAVAPDEPQVIPWPNPNQRRATHFTSARLVFLFKPWNCYVVTTISWARCKPSRLSNACACLLCN